MDNIAIGDVNSKNFWDQIKKISSKKNIETNNIVDDDGNIIHEPHEAKKYVENYYSNLYEIRNPTDEFIEFEKNSY